MDLFYPTSPFYILHSPLLFYVPTFTHAAFFSSWHHPYAHGVDSV
jgi:hypothetical protein